jgi:hypothetical protein
VPEKLTIVMAYFNQPEMLLEWWAVIRHYPKDRVAFRFVDDYSKQFPLEIPEDILRDFDVMHFRVEDDIPWNEMGARNLAMHHSEGWVYMTDPDYLLLPESMAKLLDLNLKPGNFYHLRARAVHDRRELFRPENMAVLHTKDFRTAGGYDEDFAGAYGFSDTLLFKFLRDVAGAKDNFVDEIWMDHYTKGTIPGVFSGLKTVCDAASPAVRDTTINQPKFDPVLKAIRRMGARRYLPTRRPPLRFQWSQIHPPKKNLPTLPPPAA